MSARFSAQLLAGRPARSATAVVDRLLAVQAQDGRGFRLAIRARTAGTTAARVDQALEAGELVVGWLNRGTLHLVRRDDYWWLHALTAPRQRVGNRRRLQQEGVGDADAARGVEVIANALQQGPTSRAALRDRLVAEGIPIAGQALVHVLYAASIAGRLVRGPSRAGGQRAREQLFVDPHRWLGSPETFVERDELLVRLASRYLAGHGPATPEDLSAWAGIPLGDARRAFVAMDAIDAMDIARGTPALPRPRLLGPFDPILHGWKSRDFVVGPYRSLVTVNGLFRPVVLVDGRAVGTWTMANATLSLRLFEAVAPEVLDVLEHDAVDVGRFLAQPVRTVDVVT